MRLLGCCNVVARVLWVVARVVARIPMMVAIWLLGCCYAVARVLRVVARVLLYGC